MYNTQQRAVDAHMCMYKNDQGISRCEEMTRFQTAHFLVCLRPRIASLPLKFFHICSKKAKRVTRIDNFHSLE